MVEVKKELTGRNTEPHDTNYFKIYNSEFPVVEQALETAALMLGRQFPRPRATRLRPLSEDKRGSEHRSKILVSFHRGFGGISQPIYRHPDRI